jgi:ABC-2 type transport system ATP-binding protein
MNLNASAGAVLAVTRHTHGSPVVLILPILIIGAVVYFIVRRRGARAPRDPRPPVESPKIRPATGDASVEVRSPEVSVTLATARPIVPLIQGSTDHASVKVRSPEVSVPLATARSIVPMTQGSADQSAIRLDNLTKIYGARKAVDGLSFGVRPGAICGFVGPNGAGKTTTIRMLLGLITPTSGTATVLGHSISEPASYLSRVGAMIEGPAFYPSLSARKNLDVLARLGGIDRDRVELCLDQVDLGARGEDPFKSYSLGMKQRLGIAAALLPDPELLVLDEPTNGLDPTGIRDVRVLLRSLADRGTTVLVSSHLLEELQQMCDDVVIIREGQLLFAGPVDELVVSQAAELVAVPEQPRDLDRLVALCVSAGYAAMSNGDGRVHVAAPSSWAGDFNRSAMTEGITLVELGTTKQSLEDVFFELTEEHQ